MSKSTPCAQFFVPTTSEDIIDFGICTCYYEPQVRKNRTPTFFEELEPRQLLSASPIDGDEQGDTYIVEPYSNEGVQPASSDDTNIVDDAVETVTDAVQDAIDWAKTEFMEYVTSTVDATDLTAVAAAWGTITASEVDDYNLEGWSDISALDHTLNNGDIVIGADLNSENGDLPYYYCYSTSTITLSGDFVGAEGVDTFGILTNGEVIFDGDVSFIGISTIVIVADSITFDGTTYLGGSLTLSALGDITVTDDSQILAVGEDTVAGDVTVSNPDITISCLGTVSIGDNVTIAGASDTDIDTFADYQGSNTIVTAEFTNFTITAPTVKIGGNYNIDYETVIDIQGDFTINANLDATAPLWSAYVPITVAIGEVYVKITNTTITASSITIEATVNVDTGNFTQIDFSNWGDADWLASFENAYYLNASDALLKYFGIDLASTLPTLDTSTLSLDGLVQAMIADAESWLPFYISYASATASIEIGTNVVLTSRQGDVSIIADAQVYNEQSLNTSLVGLIFAINEGSSSIVILGDIVSAQDILISASQTNTNYIDLDTAYNTTLAGTIMKSIVKSEGGMAIAVGLMGNTAEADVYISASAALVAERDIIISAESTGDYSSIIHSYAGSKGSLSTALNINYNNTLASLSIDGSLYAKGSVEGRSSALEDYYSSTNNSDSLI